MYQRAAATTITAAAIATMATVEAATITRESYPRGFGIETTLSDSHREVLAKVTIKFAPTLRLGALRFQGFRWREGGQIHTCCR